MKVNYIINEIKIKNGSQEVRTLYSCAFENYNDAEKALVEMAKNREYEVRYTEDGIVTGAMFVNEKRGVRIILTVEKMYSVSNYEEFLSIIQ